MTRVVGLDLSITATGVACCDGTLTTWRPTAEGDERLRVLQLNLSHLLYVDPPELVVIEDLPTHAHSAGITGMVHGVVRAVLLERNVPYALVAPASLKKYATGKGNAPKSEMRMQLYKRTGVDEPDDNAVDAAWLRHMGTDHLLGEGLVPQTHRAALTKVRWPLLEVVRDG